MKTIAIQGWALTCAALIVVGWPACMALQPPAPAPEPVVSAPDPAPAPPSSPDPTALQLCLDNFQILNPDVPRDQLEQLFCSGDQLLSWHRQAIVKGKP